MQREIVAALPTKEDLQAMATSIVNILTRELHELRQQVDTVKERVTELESSTTSTDARLTTPPPSHRCPPVAG